MEPNYNAPQFNPERAPQAPPSMPEFTPGVAPERERQPVSPERNREHGGEQAPPPFAPQPAVLPQPAQYTPAPVTDTSILTDVPDVAKDEDRIEREWVDKAKKIIGDTHGDPFRREQAIGQLQREYLIKRYGKEIGADS